MQIWTFSKHHIFKYDFWEKTRYSNMNFWCFLVTPGDINYTFADRAEVFATTAVVFAQFAAHNAEVTERGRWEKRCGKRNCSFKWWWED